MYSLALSLLLLMSPKILPISEKPLSYVGIVIISTVLVHSHIVKSLRLVLGLHLPLFLLTLDAYGKDCIDGYFLLVKQVHVVDGSSPQPEYEFDAVRLELEMFSPELAEKPFLVAFNKMDLPEAQENWISFRDKLLSQGIEPFCMSAVKREGTHEVICAAHRLVQEVRESSREGWLSIWPTLNLIFHSFSSKSAFFCLELAVKELKIDL